MVRLVTALLMLSSSCMMLSCPRSPMPGSALQSAPPQPKATGPQSARGPRLRSGSSEARWVFFWAILSLPITRRS